MGLLTVVLGIAMAVVVGYIGILTLTSTVFYAYEVRAALKSPTDIETASSGLTKIRGTVLEHEKTMEPAVADDPTVVSSITHSVRDGGSGMLGSWDEERRVERLVPFRVEDETGTILVDPTDELDEEALEAVVQSESVEFDAGEEVPRRIRDVFRPTDQNSAVERIADELEDADATDRGGDTTGTDASESTGGIETDGGTMLGNVAQRFEERYVSPGDEVYLIGDVETDESGERRLTNDGLLFRVLTKKRNGVIVGYLGYSLFFALVTLLLTVLMKNLLVDLIPEILALF